MNTAASLSLSELAALRFTVQAKLALALGVSLACSSRSSVNAWASVVCALSLLAQDLGWNVRALSVVVGSDRAAKQVQAALEAVEALVAVRASEPALARRADAVRRSIAAVSAALERARAPARRSAA